MHDNDRTRSIFDGKDIESICSGFTLAVYAEGALYDSKQVVGNSTKDISIGIPANDVFQVYVLANMWLMDSSGKARRLVDAPGTETEMKALEYRLDGSPAAGGLRSERFGEIASLGIPAAGCLSARKEGGPQNLNLFAEFLLSKVVLTVCHDGLTGISGQGSSTAFANSSVFLRQVNCRLAPFASDGSYASGTGDLLPDADFDAVMVSATDNRHEYVYYLPENLMGVNESVKSPKDKVPANAPGGRSGLVSYVEYTGLVDGGGFNGSLKCQFCLGSNSTTDFNVVRNTVYNVGMNFSTGTLFSEPGWKSDADIDDTRLFVVTKDTGYSASRLLGMGGDGDFIAVRRSRPGSCYIYLNNDGSYGSTNSMKGRKMAPSATYSPESLDDSRWWCDFDCLDYYGIGWSYDEATSKLTFSVTNADVFDSHIGDRVPLRIFLLPGGPYRDIVLALYPEQTVTQEGDLYVGMAGHATVSGFATSSVTCYDSSPGAAGTVKYDGDKGRVYLPDTPAQGPCVSLTDGCGTFDFIPYRSTDTAGGCVLTFVPDDPFNDDPVSVSCDVLTPTLSFSTATNYLYITGEGTPANTCYLDKAGEIIPYARFDPLAYAELLAPSISFSGTPFGDGCVTFSPEGTGSAGYPCGEVSVSSIPASYDSSRSYEVKASASSDGSGSASATLVIPAFQSSGPSGMLARLEDYSLINPSLLSPSFKPVQDVAVTDPGFRFGVSRASDVSFEVIPTCSESYRNDCLKVRIMSGGLREGPQASLSVKIEDTKRENTSVLHSAGPHKVTAYVTNIHSGQTIRSKFPFNVEVYCHAFVGALVEMGNYRSYGLDASLYGVAMQNLPKISLLEVFDSGSISVGCNAVVPSADYGAIHKTVSKSDRVEALWRMPEPGHDDPYLEVGYSTSGSDPDAMTRLSRLYSDKSGDEFYGGYEFFGSYPLMSLLGKSSGQPVSEMDVPLGTLKDASGKGYYILHRLEDICPSTRGWINKYYGWGMVYYDGK